MAIDVSSVGKVVKLRPGFRLKGNVEDIYQEIEEVRAEHGGTIPKGALVEKAKKKRSALHREFTWNVKKAAEERWLHQEAYIMRSYMVTVEGPKNSGHLPKYVSIRVADETDQEKPRTVSMWASLEEQLRDPGGRQLLLQKAIRDLNAYRNRYVYLSELAQLFAAMDEELEALKEA